MIPYWYGPENYIYIVRKNIRGEYLLTMLQKDGGANYPVFYETDTGGVIGLGSDLGSEHTTTIRNFKYDTSGNGWLLQGKQDATFTDMYTETNCTLDSTSVLLYADGDIYSDSVKNSVWVEGEREIASGGISVVTPIPTPKPTSSGSTGNTGNTGSSGTIGGNYEKGGMLSFLVDLLALIWVKLFGIEMNVDGYTITFQQIFVYGVIAAIIIGLLINLVRRK